jgi:hypothetical protein
MLLVFTPVVADPEPFPFTGNEFISACSAPLLSPGEIMCSAYVRGFEEGIAARTALPTRFCIPDGTSPLHDEAIVRNYMNKHPEALTENVGIIVARALDFAYPCKTSK